MFNETKQRILYVEDNPGNRLLIQRVLEAEGYEVKFAENADQTFKAVHAVNFDLILMDINLPDIDGYSLTAQLRTIPKLVDVPIIALTANVMQGHREKSFQAGCNGYVQKPIDIDILPIQLSQFLKKR